MDLTNARPKVPGGISLDKISNFEEQYQIIIPAQLKEILLFGDGVAFNPGYVSKEIHDEMVIIDVSQIYHLTDGRRSIEIMLNKYRTGDLKSWNWPEDLLHIWDTERYIVAIGHNGEKTNKVFILDSYDWEIGLKPTQIADDLESLIESMRTYEELDPDAEE